MTTVENITRHRLGCNHQDEIVGHPGCICAQEAVLMTQMIEHADRHPEVRDMIMHWVNVLERLQLNLWTAERELGAAVDYHSNYRSKIDLELGEPRLGGDILSNHLRAIEELKEIKKEE